MKVEITASEKSIDFISNLLQSNFLLIEYLSWELDPVDKDLMIEVNKIGEMLEEKLSQQKVLGGYYE